MLVAYDKLGGDQVGEVPLPGRPIGTPMTYFHQGHQYIALTVNDGVPRLLALALDGHVSNRRHQAADGERSR